MKAPPLVNVLNQVSSCSLCEAHLPFGPRPIVQIGSKARILIIGQAPGRKVHETGIPWNDPSGDRLRQWMSVSREAFYNKDLFAIMPMGFCFPGTGKSGDLPPRKECAEAWHQKLLQQLPNTELTLLIGQYAQNYYLPEKKCSLTERVSLWESFLPKFLPLPHPSPRNQLWLKKNPWFAESVVPHLQSIIQQIMDPTKHDG